MVSAIIVAAFLFQDISWAQDGRPVWLEPNAGFGAQPESISAQPVKASSVKIGRDIGVTKEVYDPPNSPAQNSETIIQIQDAHASLGAQNSISEILERLVTDYDLKMVAIEGSSGFVDTSALKTFPDEKIRRDTAQALMAEGRMSAGEFYSIISKADIALYGVDDKDLYIQNREQFRKVYANGAGALRNISGLLKTLELIREKTYSPEMKDFQSHSLLGQDAAQGLSERWQYVSALAKRLNIDHSGFPNLKKLTETIDREKKISFENSNRQRDALIDAISKVAPKPQLEKLVSDSLLFKQGGISQSDYYMFLQKMARDNSIDPAPYKDLIAFTEYINIYDSIDLSGAIEEAAKLEDIIGDRLCPAADQKSLRRLMRLAALLKDLFELKLTNSGFELLRAEIGYYDEASLINALRDLSIKNDIAVRDACDTAAVYSAIGAAMDFYATAQKRDKAMLDNAVRRMKEEGRTVAAIITGGYHTRGISDLLKARNTSYVVILPKFDASKNQRPYVAILTNRARSARQGPDPAYGLMSDDYYKNSIQDRDRMMSFIRDIIVKALKKARAKGEDLETVSDRWISAYRARYEEIRSAHRMKSDADAPPARRGPNAQGDGPIAPGAVAGDDTIAVTANFPQSDSIAPDQFAAAVKTETRKMTRIAKSAPGPAGEWTAYDLKEKLNAAMLPRQPFAKKYIAVPDLHGIPVARLDALLERSGFTGPDGKITAKDTVLIIGGDVIDRGPMSAELLARLYALQDEAPGSDCEVVMLMGNHEEMLHAGMAGDDDYLFNMWAYNMAREGDADCRRWLGMWNYYSSHRVAEKARKEIRAHPVFGKAYKLLDEGLMAGRFRAAYSFNGILVVHGGVKQPEEPPDGRRIIGMVTGSTATDVADTLNEHLKEYIESLAPDRMRTFNQNLHNALWYRYGVDVTGKDVGFLQLVFHEPAASREIMGGVRVNKLGNVICADVGAYDGYGGDMACVVFEGESISALSLNRDRRMRRTTFRGHFIATFNGRTEWARELAISGNLSESFDTINRLVDNFYSAVADISEYPDTEIDLDMFRAMWAQLDRLNKGYQFLRENLVPRVEDCLLSADIARLAYAIEELDPDAQPRSISVEDVSEEDIVRIAELVMDKGVPVEDLNDILSDGDSVIPVKTNTQSDLKIRAAIAEVIGGLYVISGSEYVDMVGKIASIYPMLKPRVKPMSTAMVEHDTVLSVRPTYESMLESYREAMQDDEKIRVIGRLSATGSADAAIVISGILSDADASLAVRRQAIKALARLGSISFSALASRSPLITMVAAVEKTLKDLEISPENADMALKESDRQVGREFHVVFNGTVPEIKVRKFESALVKIFRSEDLDIEVDIDESDPRHIIISLDFSVKNLTTFSNVLGTHDLPVDQTGAYRPYTSQELLRKIIDQRGAMLLKGLEMKGLSADDPEYVYLRNYIYGPREDGLPSIRQILEDPARFGDVHAILVVNEDSLTRIGEEVAMFAHNLGVRIAKITNTVNSIRIEFSDAGPDSRPAREKVKDYFVERMYKLGLVFDETLRSDDDLTYVQARLENMYKSYNELVRLGKWNPYFEHYLSDASKVAVYLARGAESIYQTRYLMRELLGKDTHDYMFAISKDTIGEELYKKIHTILYDRIRELDKEVSKGKRVSYSHDDDMERYVLGRIKQIYENDWRAEGDAAYPGARAIIDSIYAQARSAGIFNNVKDGDTVLVVDEWGFGTFPMLFKFIAEKKLKEEGKNVTITFFEGGNDTEHKSFPRMYAENINKDFHVRNGSDILMATTYEAASVPHSVRVRWDAAPIASPDVAFSLSKPTVLLGAYMSGLLLYNGVFDFNRRIAPNALKTVINDTKEDRKLRIEALDSLGSLWTPESIEAMLEALEEESRRSVKDQELIVAIIRKLKDVDGQTGGAIASGSNIFSALQLAEDIFTASVKKARKDRGISIIQLDDHGASSAFFEYLKAHWKGASLVLDVKHRPASPAKLKDVLEYARREMDNTVNRSAVIVVSNNFNVDKDDPVLRDLIADPELPAEIRALIAIDPSGNPAGLVRFAEPGEFLRSVLGYVLGAKEGRPGALEPRYANFGNLLNNRVSCPYVKGRELMAEIVASSALTTQVQKVRMALVTEAAKEDLAVLRDDSARQTDNLIVLDGREYNDLAAIADRVNAVMSSTGYNPGVVVPKEMIVSKNDQTLADICAEYPLISAKLAKSPSAGGADSVRMSFAGELVSAILTKYCGINAMRVERTDVCLVMRELFMGGSGTVVTGSAVKAPEPAAVQANKATGKNRRMMEKAEAALARMRADISLKTVHEAATHFVQANTPGVYGVLMKTFGNTGRHQEEFLGELVEARSLEKNIRFSRIIDMNVESYGAEMDCVLEISRSKYQDNNAGDPTNDLPDGIYLVESKTQDRSDNLSVVLQQTMDDKIRKYQACARRMSKERYANGVPIKGIIFAVGGDIIPAHGIGSFRITEEAQDTALEIDNLKIFSAYIPEIVIGRSEEGLTPKEEIFVSKLVQEWIKYEKIAIGDKARVEKIMKLITANKGISGTQLQIGFALGMVGLSSTAKSSETKDVVAKKWLQAVSLLEQVASGAVNDVRDAKLTQSAEIVGSLAQFVEESRREPYFAEAAVDVVLANAREKIGAILRKKARGDTLRVLDIFAGYNTYFPHELRQEAERLGVKLEIDGIGLNPDELKNNPSLTDHDVRDLNSSQVIPDKWLAKRYDVVMATSGMAYVDPDRAKELFGALAGSMAEDALMYIVFNSGFYESATQVWKDANGTLDRALLVQGWIRSSGSMDRIRHDRRYYNIGVGVDKPIDIVIAYRSSEAPAPSAATPTELLIGVTSKEMEAAVRDSLGQAYEVVIVQSSSELDDLIRGNGVAGIFIDSGVTVTDVMSDRFKSDIIGLGLSKECETIFAMGSLDEKSRIRIAEAVRAILPDIESMSAADIFAGAGKVMAADPAVRGRINDIAAMVAWRKKTELALAYNSMPMVDKSAVEGKTYVMATTEKVAMNDIFNSDNMKKAEDMGVVNCFIYGKLLKTEDDARKYLLSSGYEGSLDKIKFINNSNMTYAELMTAINAIPGLTSSQNVGIRLAAGEMTDAKAQGDEKVMEISEINMNGVGVVAAINSYQTLLKMLTMPEKEYADMLTAIADGQLPPDIAGYDPESKIFKYLPKILPIDYGREIETFQNAVKLISTAA